MGEDPVTGQPIHELLEKDDYHVCKPAQSTKWLNSVFLNRCYREIRKTPLTRIPQIYEKVLNEMKEEFFSQAPEDWQSTEALQVEFEQNVRSYRNIAGSLYRYRWQWIPKDPPVNIILCDFILQMMKCQLLSESPLRRI